MPQKLVLVLLVGMLSSPAVSVSAQAESTEYKRAVTRAVTAYNESDYGEAARQFQRAHELSPNARTWRGIGMSEFELGHYDRSVEALEHALLSAEAPLDGELRAEAERLLREALSRVGKLHLELEPSSAQVTIDGVARELDARRVLVVAPGPHVLEAEAPGHERTRRSITVAAGRDLDVALALAPLASQQSEKPRWFKRPWLWTGLGLVVAGAVAGGVLMSRQRDGEPQTSSGVTLYAGAKDPS